MKSDETQSESNAESIAATPPMVFRTVSPFAVPAGGVIDVPLLVFGLRDRITSIALSLYLRHHAIGSLNLSLISPTGRVVVLSAATGGDARSLGESCASPLVFDDAAPLAIDRAAPPYQGSYRPLARLNAFTTLPADLLNGCWHLVISDVGEPPIGALLACAALVFRR